MTAITGPTGAGSASAATQKTGFAALGAGDFVRLMTAQMQLQDPFDPVDNKDMLAQMAQFTSLSNATDMNETLKRIAEKLDAVLAGQAAAAAAGNAAATEKTGAVSQCPLTLRRPC